MVNSDLTPLLANPSWELKTVDFGKIGHFPKKLKSETKVRVNPNYTFCQQLNLTVKPTKLKPCVLKREDERKTA